MRELRETFLQRIAALGNDPERKASRKADHAALAKLETRGITKANFKHLHALVTETHATPAVPTGESPDEDRPERGIELAVRSAFSHFVSRSLFIQRPPPRGHFARPLRVPPRDDGFPS